MVAISSDDDQTTKVQVLEKNIQLDKQGRKDQETRSPHCSAREEIKMEEVKKKHPRKQEEASSGTREGKLLGVQQLYNQKSAKLLRVLGVSSG